ncbi:hypothetical protein IAU60_002454 [Kwoniella sp. DSM 27419]
MTPATLDTGAGKSTLPPLKTPGSFPFPYPKPYDIQLQLMQTVFRAIEDGKVAIVESPTGTGKSLSLLTSTLTWLDRHTRRVTQEIEQSLRVKLKEDDPDDPDWVVEHAVKARLNEIQALQEARAERLAKARAREQALRKAPGGAFRGVQSKRSRMSDATASGAGGKAARDDEEFLPEDKDDQGDADGPYLSEEVRDLMSKYEATRPKAQQEEEEEEEDVPKVYYTSRTHTQLRQLTSELLKTSFPAHGDSTAPDSTHGVSLVPLGSRKQLCINDKVRALAKAGGGDERINEACLDMQKSGKTRCEFLPGKGEEGTMLDARDAVLASVKDIEDIVVDGRKSCVCPYYATRRAVKQSQIVTLPYNLLLQKNAREALDIDLKGQVVVIDEAHNLIDTLLSIHSTTLTSLHLSTAVFQLTHYLTCFKNRLKPVHALWIKQVLSVLQGLVKVCEGFKNVNKGKSEVLDANTLMERIGGGSDQVNPIDLVNYLKESKLARKISGYSEHLAEEQHSKDAKAARTTSARHASIAAFHVVESFLLSLVDARDDGRVLLSLDQLPSGNKVVTIKYVLLNPAERFKEVVEQARSVVLAGGTMEPVSDFMLQLFPSIPKDRFTTLSCAHVIPKENLLTQVVCAGPRKTEFEFKYSNREDEGLLAELGALVQSTIGLVPDGVVIFVPSYAFLDKVTAFWTKTSLMAKLNERKQLFFEPQSSGDTETVLRDYALAISSSQASAAPGEKSRRTGALLFAVVGGKLSEGINFSDSLGRCVIMVGLPFANVGSVELQERMSMAEGPGRAIRHANDYACILLVDKRYATPRIKGKLPKWIGQDVKVGDFGTVAKGVAGFFREKRERQRSGG